MHRSGKYVPQARDEPAGSIGLRERESTSTVEEDIVLYLTLGASRLLFLPLLSIDLVHT